jgi:hypothetical protein
VSGDVLAVFLAVVAARFLVPLLIPRYPLPAIIASLVLDGVDQTIFQAFGYDPPGYQSYDKAMDVYYLAIAYLATMRNWVALPAFRIGRALYFYRLVGVVAFELLQLRALLLVFANTFEYFFIAYEAVRSRWSTRRFSFRWWLVAAALIWVLIKLPQEYWIHIAQLDVTDILTENAWAPPLLAAILLALAATFWFLLRPRLMPPDWDWKLAADPLPEEMDTAAEQLAWHAKWGAVRSWATMEKVVLVGLIAIVYGEILPNVRSTTWQMFLGVAAVIVVNAGFTVGLARRFWTIRSAALAFLARLVANVVLVLVADSLIDRSSGDLDAGTTIFFMSLISLITTLHDRYRPILATRVIAERAAEAQGRSTA